MKNIANNPLLDLLISFSKVSGTTFISLKNYTNSNGETSTRTVNIGTIYVNAKKNDRQKLVDYVPTNDVFATAKAEMINSIDNPRKRHNPYTKLTPSVSIYSDKLDSKGKPNKLYGSIYISGVEVKGSKKVSVEGEYKADTRSELTKAKDTLRKELNLATGKIRMFKVENLGSVVMNGETVELQNA